MATYTFEYVNFVVSLIITSFLIPVIVFKSSKVMGHYKFLLLIFIISDIHYSFVHLIIDVIVGPYNDAFLFFDASGSIFASKGSILYYAGAHSQAIVLLTYHFIYRYAVTERPRILDNLSTYKSVVLMIAGWVAEIVIWLLTCYYLYGGDIEFQDYIREMVEESYPGCTEIVIGTLYWYEDGSLNVRGFIAWIIFNIVLSICLGSIAFCSYRIVKALSGHRVTVSARSAQLQKQLFATLVLQLLFPLTLIYLPCAFDITAPLVRIHFTLTPRLQTFIFTIFPALDALVILFGITDYRAFFFSLFVRKNSVDVVPHTMATSEIIEREHRHSRIY